MSEIWKPEHESPRVQSRGFEDLARYDGAARLFLDTLYQHYFDAVLTGKLDEWKEAGHAVITLLAYAGGLKRETCGPLRGTLRGQNE